MAITVSCIFSSGVAKKNIMADDTGSTPEGVSKLTTANNRFALDLYAQLKGKGAEENVFFSPYSIFIALTMTYEGAKGETAREMEYVVHIPEDAALRRPNLARLYNIINKKEKKYKLSTANALWAQKGYPFLKEYTEGIERYYGGKISTLDFAMDSENARKTINKWVEEQTNNKIKDLIPSGVLNALTRLVLTNAIYFKGMWLKQFNEEETKEEDFRIGSGKRVKVKMMQLVGHEARFKYAEIDGVQILEMPYEGEEVSMLIILPEQDDIVELEKSITLEKLSEWKSMMGMQRVDVFIPRFKLKTKYFMADLLKKMGMPTPFSDLADFSGMNGTGDLCIQDVIHQAFVEVNEEGTEAAAATGVVVGITSATIRTPVFRADHPFIFIIQENTTGSILFMGRVSNPEG